jgi:3-oxoacyl-[acyl-carrier-protein] synthase I
MSSARFVITGAGAVTSVGRSAPAACAAIRAGISRPRPVTWFKVLDQETQGLVPLMGHPIQGYTEGFVGWGRLVRLARGCVADLLRRSKLSAAHDRDLWERTGLLVVAPTVDAGLPPEKERPRSGDVSRSPVAFRLSEALRIPFSSRCREVVSMGHAGTAAAIERALSQLVHLGLERFLIVAMESYLDPSKLEALAISGRLKTDSQVCGLMPGEAGVCLLLETPASARRRGAAPLASIVGVATGQEEHHVNTGGQSIGLGLTRCIREVRTVTASPIEGDIFCDLNGENWRANQLGFARVRLGKHLADPKIHLPCTAVGDTGAASGALGVCLALHSLVRGCSRTGYALILSSSEDGKVGCVSLQAVSREYTQPPPTWGRET